MATPVLPYPDMDFTPLDILTAAEMDQMVANDQYLRDFCAGLADGTNLSDGVIQARKLVPGLSSYSTTEQDTGVTWVDGKKIYKKTINFGSLPNNTSKSVNTGISNMETLITYEGVSTNGTTMFVLPSLRPFGAALEIGIWFSKTEVTIEAGNDRTGFSAYVTLYYTKTS